MTDAELYAGGAVRRRMRKAEAAAERAAVIREQPIAPPAPTAVPPAPPCIIREVAGCAAIYAGLVVVFCVLAVVTMVFNQVAEGLGIPCEIVQACA